MKRTVIEHVFIMAFLLLITGFLSADLAMANPELLYFKPIYCETSILSPQISTYNNETIPINFTIITNCILDTNLCYYILDGQEEEKVEGFQIIGEEVISDEMMPDINTTYFAYTEYTFWGQILLSNLSYGMHKLSVHAQESKGDTVAYETITFTIPDEPEPFPTVPVAAASVGSVIVVAAALLVYFKKHKH